MAVNSREKLQACSEALKTAKVEKTNASLDKAAAERELKAFKDKVGERVCVYVPAEFKASKGRVRVLR